MFFTECRIFEKKYAKSIMNDFDEKARSWDQNPINEQRSAAIAENLFKRLSVRKDMTALDFGAGTGILSFILADHIATITMMDTSQEMVKVMEEKVLASNHTNLKPVFFDLVKKEFKHEKFDLIFTQMVLHHIENISSLLSRFHDMLNKEGFLAIADLYAEDGSFHGDGFSGHNGFDVQFLTNELGNSGFHGITFEQCFVIQKMTKGGEKDFPVFLMIATK